MNPQPIKTLRKARRVVFAAGEALEVGGEEYAVGCYYVRAWFAVVGIWLVVVVVVVAVVVGVGRVIGIIVGMWLMWSPLTGDINQLALRVTRQFGALTVETRIT